MGNPFLLQACLRLEHVDEPLELGKEYSFTKEGHRLYQINVAMDLRTNDWKFKGRIIITKYFLGENKTEGTYIPVKIFTEEENDIITKTYVSEEEMNAVLKEKKF